MTNENQLSARAQLVVQNVTQQQPPRKRYASDHAQQSFLPPHLDGGASNIDATQSLREYAEPTQALVFLDWDDTLFPTSYLRRLYDFPFNGSAKRLRKMLKPCGEVIKKFLETACMLSTRCVIVTLAEPGWIEQECLPLFDSSVRQMFEFFQASDNLRIVYADRGSNSWQRAGLCATWLSCVFGRSPEDQLTGRARKLMEGKKAAMMREAGEFYSRYPHQSWKNMLSIGDSMLEYTAMQRVGSLRRAKGGKERHLRSKVVRFETEPSLTAITLQLRLFEELLPQLIRHNGCLNLNLADDYDPLKKISKDLGLPEILELQSLRCIWEGDVPFEMPFAQALLQVRQMVQSQAHKQVSLSDSGSFSPILGRSEEHDANKL
jgi:hypothetical protein